MQLNKIKARAKKSVLLRRLVRQYTARFRYFDWSRVLGNGDRRWPPSASDSDHLPKVLIPTSVGSWVGSTHVESMLAVALSLRNARVELMLCDRVLPACLACEYGYIGRIDAKGKTRLSRSFCSHCYSPADRAYRRLGIKTHRFSDWITSSEISESHALSTEVPIEAFRGFSHNGLKVGEQAYAGALRFFARGNLDDDPAAELVLRQYLAAALISACVFDRLFNEMSFNCVAFNHGIYVPQGIIGAICRRRDIPVVNWNPAYRKRCFIFSHQNSYHHTMISEPVKKWEDLAWNEQREKKLMSYLESRRQGTNDWIWFHDKPVHQVNEALEQLGVDFTLPCIGLLTSVLWDAALHYADNAFDSMLAWLYETIDYFKTRKDLQLVIRVHPAEIQAGLPSRQKIGEEIKTRYARLPSNVFMVGPESPLSTYAIMQKCNSVIIYNTKTGIELAAMGIPVIVAGEAWIRNKGFATDVTDPETYRKVLDRLPQKYPMSETDTLRAKKYAYHFFFRRMIPLEFMEPTRGNPPYRLALDRLASLKPGQSQGLDLICDGILNGTDFIFDAPEASG